MKHLSFFAAIGLFAAVCSCSPLRIVLDSTAENKERTVLTSNASLFRADRGHIYAAMGSRIIQKDTIIAILLTYDENTDHGVFDLGNRLMVRLGDNSEIFLENVYDKEFDSHTETNTTTVPQHNLGFAYTYSPFTDMVYVEPYTISTMVQRTYTTHTTNSYALYLVTKEQLFDIMNKGIVKLRVEIEDRELDMPNPERASEILYELGSCLYDRVVAGVVRTDF